MRTEVVRAEFVPEAAALWSAHYQNARDAKRSLPDAPLTDDAAMALAYLFGRGDGFAAFEGGKMAGYLCFYDGIENFFGNVKGAFSPLVGNAFPDAQTCLALYTKAASHLARKRTFSHAICVFANERDILETLALEGFGVRCADAMRSLDEEWVPARNAPCAIRECAEEDMPRLFPLADALKRHLSESPVFMPSGPWDETSFQKRRKKRNSRFFTAEMNGDLIGYAEAMDSGENIVSEQRGVKNLCGMYVRPEYRGLGVAEALSAHVAETMRREGIGHLGVDFETLNPQALRFWRRHFEIYTYSLTRRIDERSQETCSGNVLPRKD